MTDKISEAIGLIQQAIDENTRTARGTSGGCDVDFQVCDVCKKACDEDLGGHEEGCFVGWMQEALRILDDTAPPEDAKDAALKTKSLRSIVADDSLACTFQNMAHYRTFLLKAFDAMKASNHAKP